MTRRVTRMQLSRLRSSVASQSSSLIWSKVRETPAPALFTSTSTDPARGPRAWPMPCSTPPSVERSPIPVATTLSPSSSDTSLSRSSSISTKARFAPSSAKSAAVARPIPLAAPVIRTFRPSRSRRIGRHDPAQGHITANARARMPSPSPEVSAIECTAFGGMWMRSPTPTGRSSPSMVITAEPRIR